MSSPTHDEEDIPVASTCDENVPTTKCDETVTPMKTSVTPSRSSSRGSSPSPSVVKSKSGFERVTSNPSHTKCTCTTRQQHETKSNFLDFEVVTSFVTFFCHIFCHIFYFNVICRTLSEIGSSPIPNQP